MSSKTNQTTAKQGKQTTATASPETKETPSAVSVVVSPILPGSTNANGTTTPSGSGIQGDASNPAERRPLTAKERLEAALLESPPEAAGRHKDNPVFRSLEEVEDLIRDCKLGINGKAKMTTKQVCFVLSKAGITCSTASLSNFYAFKGWTGEGKRGVQKV